jgi:neutral ceramidase
VPAARQEELKLDRTVSVIRVDGADGDPIGLWSNFAIHQTSFGDENLLLSGDNAATTERLVEREVARESGMAEVSPGAPGEGRGPVLVWTNGAEGDVSPSGAPRNPDGDPLDYVTSSAAGANVAGIKVAEGVLGAWRDAGADLAGELELAATQTFKLMDGDQADGRPVGPITALGAGISAEGFCWPGPEEVEPAGPGQGKKFPLVAGAGLVPQTAPVSLLRVGDTAITSMPFEVTTQMGRRINDAVVAESGGELDSAVMAGLSNGYLSYMSTPEEYDHCGYEGSFTLFGRHQGPLFRDTAKSLVPALLGAGDAPATDPEPLPVGGGTPNPTNPAPTPEPESAVAQPQDTARFGRVSFTWRGGDPSVDAPRGKTFVSLQHREGGEWVTVGVDDGPESTTVYDDEAKTWTETWQFSNCEPLGTYRFVATGMAVRAPGGAPEPYTAASDEFELGPMAPLQVFDATVAGETARVRARYPDPGPGALLALPRRVRTGEATIELANGREVVAKPDAAGLAFEAKVPPSSAIESVSVDDGCGNATR